MSYSTTTGDFEVQCQADGSIVAEFSSMNGIEGQIFESDIPKIRLHSSQLLAIAKFFIDAASERAEEEVSQVERDAFGDSLNAISESGSEK